MTSSAVIGRIHGTVPYRYPQSSTVPLHLLASEPMKARKIFEGINFILGRLRNGGRPFQMKKNKKTN